MSQPLDGLDEGQREAASILRGPVRVLAGAGTGKTRVITHRIAHGVDTGAYSPGRVMALTFTAKAAGEMRGRLRALGVEGVSARTFHATALAQLNFFWPQVAGDTAPTLVDSKLRLLSQAAESVRIRVDGALLRAFASRIEWRKVAMRSIDEDARRHPEGLGSVRADQVAAIQREYEKLKDARRQLDFEDVLLACAGMLESEPKVAAAVHEQYRHLTVDEFQDVSPVQFHLLRLWLGDRRDICVVGDPHQTIYSFAGADPRFLLDFEQRYPDATTVRLERNYRSDPGVLEVANTLMRGRPGALELRTTRAPGPRPSVTAFADDVAEAQGVAAAVAAQISAGAEASSVAILYRAASQSAPLLAALADRGIPATVLGGPRFFDLPEVRQAVLALRGATVAPQKADLVTDVRDILRSLGLTHEAPEVGGPLRDAWEARAALLRLAEQAPEGTTLRAFTDELIARGKAQHDPVLSTVTLSTLHAAKGLEWAHVHLVGWSEGLLPISYAQTETEIDEERRLAYVGITRAVDSLSLSRSASSSGRPRLPSRFLQELGTGTLRERGAAATGAGRPARGA